MNTSSVEVGGTERVLTDFPGHQRLKGKAMQEVRAGVSLFDEVDALFLAIVLLHYLVQA